MTLEGEFKGACDNEGPPVSVAKAFDTIPSPEWKFSPYLGNEIGRKQNRVAVCKVAQWKVDVHRYEGTKADFISWVSFALELFIVRIPVHVLVNGAGSKVVRHVSIN